MNFGDAISYAKTGSRVARTGWNGSGMYAYIVPAGEYPPVTEIARQEFGEKVPYRSYWALKTAQGDVATWAPSGSDSLAEDWFVYDPTPTNKCEQDICKGTSALSVQVLHNEDSSTYDRVTAVMRESDEIFQSTSGSTRHYVRDVFLPLLEKEGLKLCTLH